MSEENKAPDAGTTPPAESHGAGAETIALQAEIKKLKDEAGGYRIEAKKATTALNEATKRLQEFDDKDKSAIEKLQDQVAKAEAVTAEAIKRAEAADLLVEVSKTGTTDSEYAAYLLKKERKANPELTLDNFAKDLRESKPHLFTPAAPPPPPESGAPGSPATNPGGKAEELQAERQRLEQERVELNKNPSLSGGRKERKQVAINSRILGIDAALKRLSAGG